MKATIKTLIIFILFYFADWAFDGVIDESLYLWDRTPTMTQLFGWYGDLLAEKNEFKLPYDDTIDDELIFIASDNDEFNMIIDPNVSNAGLLTYGDISDSENNTFSDTLIFSIGWTINNQIDGILNVTENITADTIDISGVIMNFVNDNDGAVGDSSFVISKLGNLTEGLNEN